MRYRGEVVDQGPNGAIDSHAGYFYASNRIKYPAGTWVSFEGIIHGDQRNAAIKIRKISSEIPKARKSHGRYFK